MMRHICFSLYMAALLAACHTHEPNDGHSHSGVQGHAMTGKSLPVQVYTVYTERTELFVEFESLISGEETRFAAHFTALGDSFTPVGEGSVRLTLRGALDSLSTTADRPDVPGIFRLHLKPEAAGSYALVFDIATPAFSDRITLTDIAVYPDAATARAQSEDMAPGGNTITYLKEQAWKVGFANQPVHRTTFYDVVKTSGYVAAAPGAEHTLAARTPGIVSFVRQNVMAGSPVRDREPLFLISSEGFTDANTPLRIQEAKAILARARAEYERLEPLLAEQLTTQREFLLARSELERAQANYTSLTDTYGEKGQFIPATQSGVIKSLLVTPGQYVEAGQPLAVLSRFQRLTVKADLSPAAFARITPISSANFRVSPNHTYALEEVNGKVIPVEHFAERSPFIPVWFEVDNKDGFIPGAYVEVFIHADVTDNALLIPVSALMEEQGNYYCYVQLQGESFEKRELLLGGNDGRQVQVLAGIAEGERVVTRGAYNIKLSAASGTLPAHGHEH